VANYKVLIKPSAAKELEEVPDKGRRRVAERVAALSQNPRPPGCEKLTGGDRFRIRQGNYRIVYSVADKELTVLVVRIGNRKDVYR